MAELAGAGLDPIRKRSEMAGNRFPTWDELGRSARDVPRLLAAVEAVLGLADKWGASAAELDRDATQSRKSPYAGDHALGDTDEALARELRQCAADLRADLLAALTGEDNADD